MGATTDFELINGVSAKDAFTLAQDSYKRDYPYGYSGTMAEATGWKLYTELGRGITPCEANIISLIVPKKWGPTLLAIPLDVKTLSKVQQTILLPTNPLHYVRQSLEQEEIVLRYMKMYPENAVLSYRERAVTPKGGKVNKSTTPETYCLETSNGITSTFASLAKARSAAQEYGKKGFSSKLIVKREENFTPSEPVTYVIEITVAKILKSTKTVFGQYWAMGCYAE